MEEKIVETFEVTPVVKPATVTPEQIIATAVETLVVPTPANPSNKSSWKTPADLLREKKEKKARGRVKKSRRTNR